MAIYIRCPKCKSDQPVKKKNCKNCNEPLPREDKKYRVIVKHNKKTVTEWIPGSLKLARDIERKLKTEMREGVYFDRKKEVLTLNRIWEEYFTYAKGTTKGWKTGLSRYNVNIRDRLGKKKMDMISPMNISRMILDLKKEGKAPKGIKDIIELVNRLFNYAARYDLYRGDNPVKRVKLPMVPEREPEYLKDEQLKALWQACENYPDRQIGNIVKFFILTGRRRGEALKLLWQDVDLEKGVYIIRDPKSGRDEKLHLSSKALNVLKDQSQYKVENSAYVFPGRNGHQRHDINKPWKKVKEMAGLPRDLRLHTLRHNFASVLASKGIDLYVVQKLLAHRTPKMTQRYSHLFDDAKKKGLQTMDQTIDDVLTKEKDKEAALK